MARRRPAPGHDSDLFVLKHVWNVGSLADDSDIEVLAIDVSGNQSITESSFVKP